MCRPRSIQVPCHYVIDPTAFIPDWNAGICYGHTQYNHKGKAYINTPFQEVRIALKWFSWM